MSGFKKNTAVTGFPFALISATDGSAVTTGTPVGFVTLDGGAQTAIGDVTPVHEGNGQWTFDLTAAEMNGDIVGFLITHASAINVHFTIKTDTKIVSELNDVAATDIVSAGAITTTGGAVSNVTTVATTTANTDMRGTDSALLAASAPANFGDLAITITTGRVSVGTNNDKTGYSMAAGGIVAASFGAGAIDAAAIATGAIDADALAADAGTEIADALLNRDMAAVTVTNGRSPINALRFLRNKWDVAAGTLTVKEEDDATTAWTAAISVDAAANPIIGSDPV